jgi:hypothetical protein
VLINSPHADTFWYYYIDFYQYKCRTAKGEDKGVIFFICKLPLKICKLAKRFHWRLTALTQSSQWHLGQGNRLSGIIITKIWHKTCFDVTGHMLYQMMSHGRQVSKLPDAGQLGSFLCQQIKVTWPRVSFDAVWIQVVWNFKNNYTCRRRQNLKSINKILCQLN